MKAILVCVDYSDLLAITLPYNRHHFETVTVVTSLKDFPNVLPIAEANRAEVFATDSFYDDGARFNKWRALEEGLDEIGRTGWICIMDADVLWPREVGPLSLVPGLLLSPLRRMFAPLPLPFLPSSVPPEREWGRFPIHRNVNEWAGYTQIFHASDPVLGPAPWHETDWAHAGGADSFFQAKWSPDRKRRTSWQVLHLGPAGENWAGRSSAYLDGSKDGEAEERRRYVAEIWRGRNERRVRGEEPFGPERIPRA